MYLHIISITYVEISYQLIKPCLLRQYSKPEHTAANIDNNSPTHATATRNSCTGARSGHLAGAQNRGGATLKQGTTREEADKGTLPSGHVGFTLMCVVHTGVYRPAFCSLSAQYTGRKPGVRVLRVRNHQLEVDLLWQTRCWCAVLF